MEWALNPVTRVLTKEQRTQRWPHGEGHVKMQAETGVVLAQSREQGEPSTYEEATKNSSPEPLEGRLPCQTVISDLQLHER